MTEERLQQLEAACRANADNDGKVRLESGEVLDLVKELRELRNHATALSAHQGTIAHMHRLLTSLRAYAEHPTGDEESGTGRIAIQDPGR
jgi:hypothetical protein